jgi:hypothetical protein
MTTLTPEQALAARAANGRPVQLEDPETREKYLLVKEDAYRQPPGEAKPEPDLPEIPEGIRRSQEAFFRALPDLLKQRSLRGRWVAYSGEEQVKVGKTMEAVIRECNRRGLGREEYDVFVIEPQSPEPEEVTFPSAWWT